jgi:hypothetical protein
MVLRITRDTRPRCLLLDANTVITAYEHKAWDVLIARFRVSLPATVIKLEALFFRSRAGNKELPLNLRELVSAGKVIQLSATAEEIDPVVKFCDRFFAGQLHAGEIEALALLKAGKAPDHHFCTADGPAIEAAVMLDLRERLACFEAVLESVGLTKSLPHQYRGGFFDRHVKQASQKKIMHGL